MELDFMELEFHKKCHYRDLKHQYRASYGAIKLKKKIIIIISREGIHLVQLLCEG